MVPYINLTSPGSTNRLLIMMLCAVLLALVAVAAGDQTLDYDGRQLLVVTSMKNFDEAKAECASRGAQLLTICNEEELNAVRAAGIQGPVTTEHWIGLPSSLNHNSIIPEDQLASMDSGDRCRILSNWASKPWSVYTKNCNGPRPFICETGSSRTFCPVSAGDKNLYIYTSNESYDDAKANCEGQGNSLLSICSVDELNAVRAVAIPGPVTTEYWIGLPSSLNHNSIIPEDQLGSINSGDRCRILSNWASKPWSVYTKNCSNTRPYICQAGAATPCPDPTEAPVTCPKQRELFKANGLPVEPSFEVGSCKFERKQCNAEKCFCVSPKKGKRKYGSIEVPLGNSFDCTTRPRKCLKNLFKVLLAEQAGETPAYKPQCTSTGTYEPKQCSTSECWCVRKRGREINNTRSTMKDSVQCEEKEHDHTTPQI